MHFYKILILIVIYFLLNNQLVFAERKYHRVRCRDVFCSDASKSNRKNLIKLANERRGYKEPREPWNLRLRYQREIELSEPLLLSNQIKKHCEACC